jgi:carboxyl-terminal processing protease
MDLHPRPVTLLAILMSMVSGVALGILGHRWVDVQTNRLSSDLETFSQVVRQIHDNYVDPLDESTLVDDAIAGMMKRLDPHSSYLDRAALSDLTEQTTGRFGGIGVELGYQDGRIAVIAPIDDSPAARAGVRSGDILLDVAGEPLGDATMDDVVRQLRGEPGTQVDLTLDRPGSKEAVRVHVTRGIVSVGSVRSRFLEPGYGYIRVSQFQNSTGKEVAQAIARLTAEHGPLGGLVLDLRNNPGGVLQASVEVADAFLTEGLIVYTKGRQPSSDLEFSASGGDLLNGAPLAVLINKGSASASEIVAGALQDHGRALVLGRTSYGKGSVQAVLSLNADHALKLTTARYFTPNGRSIQSDGIHPDIDVDDTDDVLFAEALRQLKRG